MHPLKKGWDAREALRAHEEDLRRHPRVRRCPGCEDAAWGKQGEEDECDIHGDPYEGPFEFEFRFHELFGHFPWEEPSPSSTQ